MSDQPSEISVEPTEPTADEQRRMVAAQYVLGANTYGQDFSEFLKQVDIVHTYIATGELPASNSDH